MSSLPFVFYGCNDNINDVENYREAFLEWRIRPTLYRSNRYMKAATATEPERSFWVFKGSWKMQVLIREESFSVLLSVKAGGYA
jgi:hypothetical protein